MYPHTRRVNVYPQTRDPANSAKITTTEVACFPAMPDPDVVSSWEQRGNNARHCDLFMGLHFHYVTAYEKAGIIDSNSSSTSGRGGPGGAASSS